MIKVVLKVYGAKYERTSYWYIGKNGQMTRRISKKFASEYGWDDLETAMKESDDSYSKLESELISKGYSVDGECIDVEIGGI